MNFFAKKLLMIKCVQYFPQNLKESIISSNDDENDFGIEKKCFTIRKIETNMR